MNFQNLVDVIAKTQKNLQGLALRSVDHFLTIRNWLIGCYIVEYEQKGKDRAKYGEKLLGKLEAELRRRKLKGVSWRSLQLFKQFYLAYPQIARAASEQSSGSFQLTEKLLLNTFQLADPIAQTVSAQSESSHVVPAELSCYSQEPEVLLRHFTFSHFVELIKVNDLLKRAFYKVETIKGNWSVRCLKRQIESLLAKEKRVKYLSAVR